MADQVHDDGWSSLPQGVVQTICNFTAWRDCLSARLACKSWSTALSPLIVHLRVHVACGCNSTAVGGEQPVQLLKKAFDRLKCISAVQLVLTQHTTGPQLADVLQFVGCQERIDSVHLWEIPAVHSYAEPRQYARNLRLARLQHVRTLSIRSPVTWSLQDIWNQVCSFAVQQEDDEASSTTALTALESFTIHQVASDGQQQVCNPPFMLPEPCATASSSSGPSCCTARGPDGLLAPLDNLKHLTTPLPGQKCKQGWVSCTLSASHDNYMRALAAGLPHLQSLRVLGGFQGDTEVFQAFGQLTKLHACVGGLLRSLSDLLEEESTITKPVQSISQLHELDLTGAEGMKSPVRLEWLTATPQLQHLTACLMQSSQDVCKVQPEQLRSLCALHLPKSPELLNQIAAVGKGLTTLTLNKAGPGAFSIRHASSWRRHAIKLQPHLAAFSKLHSLAILSGEEHLAFTIQEPAEIWAAMPHLKCLQLQGVGLGYTRQDEPTSDRLIKSVQTQYTPSVKTSLREHRMFDKIRDLPVLWSHDLPRELQQLELSRYLLVVSKSDLEYNPGLKPRHEALSVQATGSTRGMASSGLGGLQKLTLADCFTVLGTVDYSWAWKFYATQGSGWLAQLLYGTAAEGSEESEQEDEAAAGSQVSDTAAPEKPPSTPLQQQQHLRQAATSEHSDVELHSASQLNRSLSPRFWGRRDVLASPMSVWPILQLLGPNHSLQDLQLLRVADCAADVPCIVRYFGQHLQRLRINTVPWDDETRQQRAWAAETSVQAVADAATAGQLQELTELELNFGQTLDTHIEYSQFAGMNAGSQHMCGVGALNRLCYALPGLRGLKLTVDLAHCSYTACSSVPAAGDSAPAGPHDAASGSDSKRYECIDLESNSNNSSDNFIHSMLRSPMCICSGPWALTNWQRLHILNVSVLVPPLRVLGDLGPRVLGRCCSCGGGLGLEAVRSFLKRSVPDALPMCEVLYQEYLAP